MPAPLNTLRGAPCCKFPPDAQNGLVRFPFLISSSDRRVLDDLDPESTPSARDRQHIHNRPAGNLLTPGSHWRPVISSESIHSQLRKHLAKPRLARLALQLEARLPQFTILSSVFRQTKNPTSQAARLEADKLFNFSVRSTRSRQTFQETSGTQWQKN